MAWLTVAGSKEGQEAFNPVKGSICARTDCDPTLFTEYLQTAMDWSTDTVVGSLTHGVVANDAWKNEIDTALGLFLTDGDMAAFQSALVDAAAANRNQRDCSSARPTRGGPIGPPLCLPRPGRLPLRANPVRITSEPSSREVVP